MKKSELIIALAESLAKRGDEVVTVNLSDGNITHITELDNTSDICTEDEIIFADDENQVEPLQKENERLKERIKELEEELEALKKEE